MSNPNPEVGGGINQPQETRGGKTYSRRDILRLGGVIGGVGVGIWVASKLGIPLDTLARAAIKTEWAFLDTKAIFADVEKKQTDLETDPDIVYGIFLNKDADGRVTDIYAIAEGWNVGPDGKRIPIGPGWKSQRYLYRSSFNKQTGKLSRVGVISPKLPIRATSVAVVGKNILITGTTIDAPFDYAAIMLSEDDGKTFNNVGFSARPQAQITEIGLVEGTNTAVLNFGGFETEGSLKLFNFDTKKVVDVSLPGGWTTRQGLSIAAAGGENIEVLASAFTSNRIDRGYVRIVMNPKTSEVISAQIEHPEINYAMGFHATKDQAGFFDMIYAASLDQYWHVIDAKTGQAAKPLSFAGWLNNKNIPGYSTDSLFLHSIRTRGATAWASGQNQYSDLEGRAVTLSWPLGSDPGSRPDLLKLYRLFDNQPSSVLKDNDFQFGIFGDKPGFLANISNRGFAFLETAADGQPLPGVLPFYLGQGLSELPSPSPASTKTTINLPVLFKNASIR